MIKLTMQEYIKLKVRKDIKTLIVISILLLITGLTLGYKLAGDKTVEMTTWDCSEEPVSGGLASYCENAEAVKVPVPLSYYLMSAGVLPGFMAFGFGMLYIYSNVTYSRH